MTSNARRDPLRELVLLARAPEPRTSNLGEHLAKHAGDLAQVFGVSPTELEAARLLDDEEVAPRVRQLLARRHDVEIQRDLERRRERSVAAAQMLGVTARWTALGAELDVDVLLGELLADRTKKWVSFSEPGGFNVAIPRHLVSATAPLRKLHLDLAGFVDPEGLHFRWRGGRGGYNWRRREVAVSLADRVLVVRLAPKVVQALPPRRRGGAWVGDILQELGYL